MLWRQSGSISREEFTLNKKTLAEADRNALFDKEDQDHDGVVSWDEFSGTKGSAPPVYVGRSLACGA